MDLADLKRWHWAVLGTLAGLAMGYARTQTEATPNPKTLSRDRFENELFANPIENKIPHIDDIVIFPPVDNVYTINFLWYVPSKDGTGWTPEPWSLTIKGNYPGTNETVVQWLARQKKEFPYIRYTFRWYDISPWAYIIWGGGGLLLVGGVWPTLIGLMTGAGLVQKKEKVVEYDLDRFGKTEPGQQEPVPAGLSTEELAQRQSQLDDMVERLEEKVGTLKAGAGGVGASGTAAGSPGTVQVLSNKPLEVSAAPAAPEEKKEYVGEFYPTVRVHKKDDEPAH